MFLTKSGSVFTLIALLTLISSKVNSAQIPINSANWKISSKGVEVVEKDGQSAFFINRGEVTYDAELFKDGIIEFDMFTGGERAFVYVYFREQSEQESEVVYLRTHKSNSPDTVQYTPVFQGRSAWQLYHGQNGTGAAYLPAEIWVTVKLQIQGGLLSVWVGNSDQPALDNIPLTGPTKGGSVTLRGNIPRVSKATYSTYFRNIKITPEKYDEFAKKATQRDSSKEAGILSKLSVSPAFEANKNPITNLPQQISDTEWQTVAASKTGMHEFLRSRQIPDGVRTWAVAADTILISPTAKTCAISLGFSDTLTLQLNGLTLAFADASYRYSENRQEGLLHDEQLTVFLPLRVGKNRLRAIVADSFGGWGFKATLRDCPSVSQQIPNSH